MPETARPVSATTARAPLSTYRLQLNADFDFDEAAAVVDYLADLGVSHLYLSPVLQAAPGSTHGYDVVDPSRPSDDLGGADGYARLTAAIAGVGLKQVLDIVPNHMAITGAENSWWWDVLENGPSSLWANHFDVTWDPPEAKLRNTLLMPILGDHYGRVLDRGEITVVRDGPVFTIRYFDHRLPVSPRTLETVLAPAAAATGDDDLAFIGTAYRRLPAATRTDPASMVARKRDAGVLREQLRRLLAERPSLGKAVDESLAALNANVDALDAFLDIQNHRIAFWRTAGRELDYRRFFDIDTLVGLRVEDPEVFADTHAQILAWVRDGVVDGLRVDHPDGLRDPESYARRLSEVTGGIWTVVEKILEHGEQLPESWPVAGTTGYDRLNAIGGLFIDPAGEESLTSSYGELTGASTDFVAVQRGAKQWAVRELLAADVNRLSDLLASLCEGRRHQRDRTRHELHDALEELLAAFSVYRTYVQAEAGVVRPSDIYYVEAACTTVAQRRPDIDPDLLAFFADLLLLRLPTPTAAEQEWVMRFQQLTGPAMAKGVEDTTFYRYTRLLALNEVGGDPGRYGVSVEEFHQVNAAAHQQWPDTMTTLSTHDTKRSADVRARLSLLSEIPQEWAAACAHGMSDSAAHWLGGDPDRHTQHLLFQTLVGAWPLSPARATEYLAKATKEAKQHTTWTEPNQAYDQARDAYVAGVLADRALIAAIEGFVAVLVEPGRINALGQALLQLNVPGVPETYQGTELWDLSLVDPDNRRPVDFALRRRLLADVGGLAPADLLACADEGLPKLRVVREALHLRRRRPELFGAGLPGTYVPLAFTGSAAGHGVGFTRGGAVAVVVPRLVLRLCLSDAPTRLVDPRGVLASGRQSADWGDTTVSLPTGSWTDLLTGSSWAGGDRLVADLLGSFPVALLEASS
ncbi:malto-oligosyltrehalose synthase [soil metagenome]